MTPEIASHFASHNERIKAASSRISACEGADVRMEEKLDKLIFWALGALVSSVLAVVGVAVQIIIKVLWK
jgi:hypothetical protein